MKPPIDFNNILIAADASHHCYQNQPLYNARFKNVLKYHAPGIAPAYDDSGAFHIDLNGNPLYGARYLKTFGFYDGFAAVADEEGFFHINTLSNVLYHYRYSWAGNFQEGYCVVNDNGQYFHINISGTPCYDKRYRYAGDFKDNIAVVANKFGLHTHIMTDGEMLHNTWYEFTDQFHKGFARAIDSSGWFHIDKAGKPIYTNRFAFVEPFYNELAFAHTASGLRCRINSNGNIVEKLATVQPDPVNILSGKMVGFWQTHTIHAAVELKVLDHLPSNTTQLSVATHLTESHCERLLRALWECDIVLFDEEIWKLTPLGKELVPSNDQFLSAASKMWSSVNKVWYDLPTRLKAKNDTFQHCFKETANKDDLEVYHRALQGYAERDFSPLINLFNWGDFRNVFATGASARMLIPHILNKNPEMQAVLHDTKNQLRDYTLDTAFIHQLETAHFDLGQQWPMMFDIIIFPRYLHYYPDQETINILRQAGSVLNKMGRVLIAEMIINEYTPNGSLLDLNMLVETGGRLRTIERWEEMANEAKLRLNKTTHLAPHLTLLELTQ